MVTTRDAPRYGEGGQVAHSSSRMSSSLNGRHKWGGGGVHVTALAGMIELLSKYGMLDRFLLVIED